VARSGLLVDLDRELRADVDLEAVGAEAALQQVARQLPLLVVLAAGVDAAQPKTGAKCRFLRPSACGAGARTTLVGHCAARVAGAESPPPNLL